DRDRGFLYAEATTTNATATSFPRRYCHHSRHHSLCRCRPLLTQLTLATTVDPRYHCRLLLSPSCQPSLSCLPPPLPLLLLMLMLTRHDCNVTANANAKATATLRYCYCLSGFGLTLGWLRPPSMELGYVLLHGLLLLPLRYATATACLASALLLVGFGLRACS
ncbi:hypothetical protein C8R42DRAFT_684017, partial [Lentinula raphanica]